jgi:epoxyqueuosine reductase
MSRKGPVARSILDEVHQLGFVLAGITTPATPPHFSTYQKWLKLNRHAEMEYLATERALTHRADPRLVFPPVRSILVLGLPYRSQSSLALPTSRHIYGRIAAYALGQDYHTLIPAKLKLLGDFISKYFGSESLARGYTDTAPILERELAQRAGLGWIGKNTCLIDPRLGSNFLLAELFLSLDLDPDEPFLPDRCGTCTRCVQACPTGCILPDRTLDAGRCISYLTIEKKGPIPKDLRPLIGNWVFGCDICQEVCPWNIRFSGPEPDPGLAPRPNVTFPDLLHDITLTPQEFNQKFHDSPVQRPHRRGYLRNVAIALGNSKSPEALPVLEQALLTESETLARGASAWAVHQIDPQDNHRILAKAARTETDPYVLSELQSN